MVEQWPGDSDYVIFSMARSGTTTLCDDLNERSLNCMYELLNVGERNAGAKWLRRLKLPTSFVQKRPLDFLQRVRAAVMSHQSVDIGSRHAFGYKVFPCPKSLFSRAKSPCWSEARLKSIVSETTACIIFQRRNITAQYESHKRAMEHDCWDTTGVRSSRCRMPVRIKRDEYSHFVQRYRNWYAQAESVCAGRRVIRDTTERYLAVGHHSQQRKRRNHTL